MRISFKNNSKLFDFFKLLFLILMVIGTFIEVFISFNFFQVSSNKFFKFSIKKLRSVSLSRSIFLKVSFFIISFLSL